MSLPYWDLLSYFLLYSFLGWVLEVVVLLGREHRLCSRGPFRLPFCPSYGLVMVLLLLVYPLLGASFWLKYGCAVLVSWVVTGLTGALAGAVSGSGRWQWRENRLFPLRGWSALWIPGQGLGFMAGMEVLHPLVSLALLYVPPPLRLALDALLTLALLADLGCSLIAGRCGDGDGGGKGRLGRLLRTCVYRQLDRAFPGLGQGRSDRGAVFARGICFDKLFWVFLSAGLLGDLIETLFVRITDGVWMSRSSLVYGPISVVWGLGAVLLTLLLHKLADKEDRYAFLAGCVLGGVYEYAISVVWEVLFDASFWDYSGMPLDFGGRTNLLFCLFWGMLTVAWIKGAYPVLSRWLERMPPVGGKLLTWALCTALILDGVLTCAVLWRYGARAGDPAAHTLLARFLDAHYPDALVKRIWPDMRLV